MHGPRRIEVSRPIDAPAARIFASSPTRPGTHADVLTLAGDSYRTRAPRELLAKDRTHND